LGKSSQALQRAHDGASTLEEALDAYLMMSDAACDGVPFEEPLHALPPNTIDVSEPPEAEEKDELEKEDANGGSGDAAKKKKKKKKKKACGDSAEASLANLQGEPQGEWLPANLQGEASRQAGALQPTGFKLKERVECRDHGKEWKVGRVVCLEPLMVQPDGETWVKGFTWDEVRVPEKPPPSEKRFFTDFESERRVAMGTAATWTPAELIEIARRRRILEGAELLSDEQVMKATCHGEEKPFIAANTGHTAEELAKEDMSRGVDGSLAVACMTGNVGLLRGCLASGMNPNQRILKTNCTALMCAVEAPCHGKVENVIGCVALLLNFRADPNVMDDKSHTALHRAYVMQLPAVVDLLLAGGAMAKQCEWGKCSKCQLQTKLALRRKPHPASEPVRAAREAVEKVKKAEREANTFEKVLEEEFGGGIDLLDFAKLLEEEKAGGSMGGRQHPPAIG
jgi:hypothetical protein